jgi:hypothetical protein
MCLPLFGVAGIALMIGLMFLLARQDQKKSKTQHDFKRQWARDHDAWDRLF